MKILLVCIGSPFATLEGSLFQDHHLCSFDFFSFYLPLVTPLLNVSTILPKISISQPLRYIFGSLRLSYW
jgi:hypothetical protein